MFASNLFMIGTTSGAPGGATVLLSGQNSYLRDLGFVCQHNSNYLVEIGYGSSNLANYIQISSCRFAVYSPKDAVVSAIYCQELTQSVIEKCVITGQAFNSFGTRQWVGSGITFNESLNCTVKNCMVQFFNNGISVNSGTTPTTQGVLISSNLVFGCNQSVTVNAGNAVNVINNVLDYNAVGGIYVDEGGGSIANNYIAVDQSTGKGAAAIYTYNVGSLSVIGNTIEEYSGAAGQNVSGIALTGSCYSNIISGNTVIYFNTGIYVSNTSNGSVVTSNSGRAVYGTFISNGSSSNSLANNTTT